MDINKQIEAMQEQMLENDREQLDQTSAATELEWLSQQLGD